MTIAAVVSGEQRWHVEHGEALDVMRTMPDACVDAIVTDPPYPEIARKYGRMTEEAWHAMMRGVVAQCRRVLKPSGSAVFILQPNSERVGRMRPWLWEFMAWSAREWNQVQDSWWWNHAAPPTVHCQRSYGLMRPSVKACVWLGPSDCYRAQDRVLWTQSAANAAVDREDRALRKYPSGHHVRRGRMASAADERGGATPFNLLPIANASSNVSAGGHGHGAGTPTELALWWTRYLCPEGGVMLDPFIGSGTMALAALRLGCRAVGIEREVEYVTIAKARAEHAAKQGPLIDRDPHRAGKPVTTAQAPQRQLWLFG